MKTFYIHKLGCPKNDVDADYIAGFLRSKGLTQETNPDNADILIVNSCGFIQSAKEESVDAVLDLARLKKSGDKKLVITGCLSQRYAEDLAREIPELDGIYGLDSFTDIAGLLGGGTGKAVVRRENPLKYREFDFDRIVDPDQVFAYLKISDGCDNRCAYCAIPDIRGQFRSRPIEKIVDEAKFLLDSGRPELILVSQESTAYGRDIYGKRRLYDLLDQLSGLKHDYWLRIMYLHPARLERELIDYMIDNERICNYFDLPLQHINSDLLASMGRQINREGIVELLEYIRSRKTRSVIRTNFITGYPGETEAMFEELCDFIREFEFDRLGAFAFSPEEGTRAMGLPKQVKELERERRYHKIMEIQRDIAFDKNEADIGKTFEVIVDKIDREKIESCARTRFDAPDIDQVVRLPFIDCVPGERLSVTITACDGYDLFGARVEQ